MFILSIILIILSSYLILSGLVKEKKSPGFFYFLLIVFSQIVLTFEVLSLFSKLSRDNFFICNIIFLIASAIFCIIKGSKCYKFENDFNKIKTAFKRDKFLALLSIGFILFCIIQLISIFSYPVIFGDALNYYFLRATSWLQNGNIHHFVTSDTRELIMPVNMDFLYAWQLMFIKTEWGSAIYSYISFFGCIYILYNFLRELNFSVRRCLWSVFIFSSFAIIGVEAQTPCADLFIGALILGSIYLFLKYVKYNDKLALYFSALSYALAIGCKTTAIIALPSVFLIFCAINYLYSRKIILKEIKKKRKGSYKSREKVFALDTQLFWNRIFLFSGVFILNFVIFSSYNYILNFLQFQNPVTAPSDYMLNEFRGGITGYFSNIVKYCFAFLDISGMPNFMNNTFIGNIQNSVLNLFNADTHSGTAAHFSEDIFQINTEMNMFESFLGVIGLFTFLPSLFYSTKRAIKKYLSTYQLINSSTIIAVLSLSFVFNLLLFSKVMVFTNFNMRYISTFMIIASPIIAYTYPRNKRIFIKIFLSLLMLNSFVFCHYNGVIKHVFNVLTHKETLLVKKDFFEDDIIYDYLLKNNPKKIAVINSRINWRKFYYERLKLDGKKIDKLLLENFKNYDLSQYDYIIGDLGYISSTNINYDIYKERMENPNKFPAQCLYLDKDNNEIHVYSEKIKPMRLECQLPFEYILSNGFVIEQNYKFNNYVIFKRLGN